MKRRFALFCTAFVLLVNGQAQSNRIGVFLKPQGIFASKKAAIPDWKGFAFSGGAYYEKSFGMVASSIGVGYTQFNSTYTSADSTLSTGKTTDKKGLLSVPIGFLFEYPATDKFFVGFLGEITINYLLTEKVIFPKNTQIVKMSDLKFKDKLYFMGTFGINLSYLITNELGVSVIPTFSFISTTNPSAPLHFGAGGCVRVFYMFGY